MRTGSIHRAVCWMTVVCLVLPVLSMKMAAQEIQGVKKNLTAMRTGQAPIIDGRIDDPCWQNAPEATDFTDPLLGTLAKDQTVAWLLYALCPTRGEEPTAHFNVQL